jgi:hypothetical protein
MFGLRRRKALAIFIANRQKACFNFLDRIGAQAPA